MSKKRRIHDWELIRTELGGWCSYDIYRCKHCGDEYVVEKDSFGYPCRMVREAKFGACIKKIEEPDPFRTRPISDAEWY